MKKRTRIGFWNIRPMLEASRLSQVLKETRSEKDLGRDYERREEQSAVEDSCGCPMFRRGMMGLLID
jgi:hypothetical protein